MVRTPSTMRRVQPAPANWFQRVGSWFAFINRRRLDLRFAVVPKGFAVFFSLLFVSGVWLMVRFLDEPYLETVRSGATDNNLFFELITHIGLSDWILYLSGAAMLIFSLRSADRFKGHAHRLWHRLMLTAWFLFSSIALSGLITLGLKSIFGRLRPPFAMDEAVWDAVPFTTGYEFASFPSGHSTTAGALAMALSLLFPRFAIIFIPLGLLVAVSRNFIGVHFPSDVFAGLLIGGVFTYLWARSFARKRLLFHFTPSGGLALRGEGRGHFHRWREIAGLGQQRTGR